MFFKARRLLSRNNRRTRNRAYDLRSSDLGPLNAYYENMGRPSVIGVQLEHCRWYGASGLSYSRDSLHPYIRTLAEYESGVCTVYEGSILQRYWESWAPRNLAEYFRIDTTGCHSLLLQTPPNHNILPWSPADRVSYMEQKQWMNRPDYRALCEAGCTPARSCGPKPAWFGMTRFQRLLSVFESIKTHGYRDVATESEQYEDQHIIVNCLVRDADVRFVVANGQHRSSALAALGQSIASVIVHSQTDRGPAVVRREEVSHWPLVRMGIFSASDAEAIFDRIFDAVPPREVESMEQRGAK